MNLINISPGVIWNFGISQQQPVLLYAPAVSFPSINGVKSACEPLTCSPCICLTCTVMVWPLAELIFTSSLCDDQLQSRGRTRKKRTWRERGDLEECCGRLWNERYWITTKERICKNEKKEIIAVKSCFGQADVQTKWTLQIRWLQLFLLMDKTRQGNLHKGSSAHIFLKSLPLAHTETHLDCFPQVPIIACQHPLYAFRNAVKAGAAGAVLFCNVSQQTWPNKQIKENSTSHRTSHEVLNLPGAFLSLTSTKPFIFANRKHL